MNSAERERLVDHYAAGYDTILEALAAITSEEWDAREAPGEWSPRQVVHHLADSEMTSAIRLRRLIAEDNPIIVGYDQDLFADRLFYDRPVDDSLAAFKAARDSTVPILRRLDEDQWQRAGTHSDSGRYAVEDWLQIYAEHADIHADQIQRARATVTG